MNSPEALPHPTGNFPSVEEEILWRFRFIDRTNPILKIIRKRLGELGLPYQRNLPLNLLALYYGIYFYNQVCRHQLYRPESEPPIKFTRNPAGNDSVYVADDLIHVNLDSRQSKEELYLPLTESTEVYGNSSIFAPSYLAQIITGLEEASHLHLDRIHQKRKPNYCSRSNHRFPKQLWKNSANNSVAYRAKLWHEFATLVVQKTYLNNYIVGEYPEVVAEFNTFFNEVVKERQKWVRQKNNLTTVTRFV